jgi:hypothetical protein
MELGVGKLVAGHAGPDGGAAQPELLDAVLELLDGQVRVLESYRGEGDEGVGVGRAQLGELFVLDLNHLAREVTVRGVPEGVDG